MNTDLGHEKPNKAFTRITQVFFVFFKLFKTHHESQEASCLCELTLHGAAVVPVCFVVSHLLVRSIKYSKHNVLI